MGNTDARAGTLTRAITAIIVLAAVASAAFGGYQLWQNHRLDARDALRAEYIDTAKDGVLRLTTISSSSADADVKKLLAITSGDFRTQFGSRTQSYSKVVKEAEGTSKGTIVSVGVERFDDQSATLLVAAHSEITNKGTSDPESRDYRFRVVVTNGDPQTISKVDFVL